MAQSNSDTLPNKEYKRIQYNERRREAYNNKSAEEKNKLNARRRALDGRSRSLSSTNNTHESQTTRQVDAMDEESLHYPLSDDYHVTFGIPLDIQALEHRTSHDKDENQVNFDFGSEDINNSTPKVFGFGRLAKIGESPWCLPEAPVSLNVPNELRDLFFGSSQMCLHFKANSRTYNNAFAFTSFGVTYDKELCRNEKNIYTFRVQGLVYHFLNDLIPKEGKGTNLQLYFHDIENEVDNRLAVSDKLKQELVLMIMKLLEVNPYSFFFRSLREIPELHDYKIILRADPGLDQRIYNVPTVDQVAAIWKDSDECEESQSRDIRVYPKSGRSQKIEYYYGCYDPLQYPLLFPRGEPGWHVGIKRKKLSERIGSQKRMRLCEGEHMVHPSLVSSSTQLLQVEAEGM
ncbi:hypothetical protein Sango_3022100 [Sesamum angolense]|uniref:Helitron helicase-like domain-containing protein n=1 Tax=Sesamum angolense TaxID=2727404 RepID=A0AAE1VSD2_9LAMI|nr:hypothetical protein Sango_3022100 [Sesamum angolense]